MVIGDRSSRAGFQTVRVFISSTFRDMQAERDHLVRFVFPKLREELLARHIHLVDMDLRWGVTSDQDAQSVCREVVDECRPRFLCMLGGRYGWIPPGQTHSITADEVHYGVLDGLGQLGNAFFYFRDPKVTAAMVEATPGEFKELEGSDEEIQLKGLKESIIKAGLTPFIYSAQWDHESRRLTNLKEFGERVHTDLKSSIDLEFGELQEKKLDEFTEAKAAMEVFIEERNQRFVLGSRQSIWNELVDFTHSTGRKGSLCLVGEPGTGKTALLARFTETFSNNDPENTLFVAHFVGASIDSTDIYHTLRRLCHELIIGTGITARIPNDPKDLPNAFLSILKQACEKKRVIILLDAVNQFGYTPLLTGFCWIPADLPSEARLILSTPPGTTLDDLRSLPYPPREVDLPTLTQTDSESIIKEFLFRYRKSMSNEQRTALLAKTDSNTPLYLLVALEELRTLGTYEEITGRIAQLPSTIRALFTWILQRLSNDDGLRDGSGQRIGQILVPRFASLMGISRHGLSQREMVELLARGWSRQDTVIPDDAQGNVAALLQLLRPYLMHRGELLDFYHSQFRESAESEYLAQDNQRQVTHRELATYFLGQVYTFRDGIWNGEIPRAFSEILYHLKSAGMWSEISTCLEDSRIFNNLPPSEYGLDYNKGVFIVPEASAVTPDSLLSLPENQRSEVGYRIALAFEKHARNRLRQAQAYKMPWPETAKTLREYDAEGFITYRDTFYTFIRYTEKSAKYALVAFKDLQDGWENFREFITRNRDIRLFLDMLYECGSEETGLSHALEDESFPGKKAWDQLKHLAASYGIDDAAKRTDDGDQIIFVFEIDFHVGPQVIKLLSRAGFQATQPQPEYLWVRARSASDLSKIQDTMGPLLEDCDFIGERPAN